MSDPPDPLADAEIWGEIHAMAAADELTVTALLVSLWRHTRAPELLPLIAARPPVPNPLAGALHATRDGATARATALLAQLDLEGDPRMGAWLAPWVDFRRDLPRPVRALIAASLPVTRDIAARCGIFAPEPLARPLSSDQWVALRRALHAADDPRIRALWADCYANPADLSPRWVLSDLYSELGNPRGPFMAESLASGTSGALSQEGAEILRHHERSWLGSFGLSLHGPQRWEGGVIVAATATGLRFGELEHPEWRFVRELAIEGDGADLRFLTVDRFPSLRVLSLVPVRFMAELAMMPIAQQLARVYVGVGSGRPNRDTVALLDVWRARGTLVLVAPDAGKGFIAGDLVVNRVSAIRASTG